MGLQKDRESIFKHLQREFRLKILLELNIKTFKGLPATKKNVWLGPGESWAGRHGELAEPCRDWLLLPLRSEASLLTEKWTWSSFPENWNQGIPVLLSMKRPYPSCCTAVSLQHSCTRGKHPHISNRTDLSGEQLRCLPICLIWAFPCHLAGIII